MTRIQLALSLGAVTAVAIGSAHAQSFVNIVDPANPTFTQALGINNSNLVVGYGNMTTFDGFQVTPPFTPGNFTRENVPGATGGTQVVGVDNAGDTVGFYIDAAGATHGFTNVGGTFTTADQPGSVFNQLLGINHNGTQIAGYSSFTDPAGMTGQQAFSLRGSTYTNINALLPSNLNSQATGVNDSGTVVGFYQTASGFSAFEDVSGAITSFEAFGSTVTQALGINDLGDIVGTYLAADGNTLGFLDNGGAFTSLDPFASTSVTANGINDAGHIVGFYVNGVGSTIGMISGVPEPATLLLFASGLAGLAFVRRRNA